MHLVILRVTRACCPTQGNIEMEVTMQNEDTIAMLKEVYQNASMGERGSRLLLERSEDSHFSSPLSEYADACREIKDDAAHQLSQYGEIPKDSGKMEQASQWMGVQMNTMIDKTSSHMAEMLIEGSTMGIVKGEKDKRRNVDAAPEAVELEDRLIRLQQKYIDTMKGYLG